jgi:Cys-tRNA(Pro)/Cys-tRNA(Cys) deacylase
MQRRARTLSFARMAKTNAARALDQLAISYAMREYEVDVDDLSAGTVAAKIGMPIAQVWKTLLVKGEGKHLGFAVLPGDAELDLKAYARLAGVKSAELAPLKEVQPLTGYIRGGVTALAAKKAYPVLIDEAFLTHDVVSVSAGVRGTQLLLAPADYVRATGAKLGPLVRR